ncbi:C-type lectin domain family 4 member E-like isoform X1 [Salmo trutta]|uniref:CD209 antigen-like protein C n=1 Tax=Salmo trutta TaxID=8032 RepID=A0A673VV22_SALTR|nr:C-type lectin domain family 4 member E-like isoform X1 [Salmo trutta]XP_029604614.1 C-type lectin domain family 4 member E-like isoform X1 [Salmo trutta]XP_029604621.1 C-type lectin domain family 4 member E-like isoform X1 [Salmo trutta]
MADYINKQVIELNKVNEENQNRATRSVKTETQLSDRRQRLYRLAAVCLGVLCVLQVTLNISLRLAFYNRGNETAEIDQLQKERDDLMTKFSNLKQTCPEGWQKFNSRWYFLSTVKKTWKESRKDCLERGADLVIINSDMEQQFLFGVNKRAWIGLTDSVTEGTWKWVDGTPLTTPSYWFSQQPDNGRDNPENGEEDCVELNTETWLPVKAWNDQSCLLNRYWICEKVV